LPECAAGGTGGGGDAQGFRLRAAGIAMFIPMFSKSVQK
jgi:hypothetical protein